MTDNLQYDVFLSYSAKDKKVVRELAERLKADGLRVWFDAWEIKPGDSIPAKIEEGLERSRVLVLCMSANAFGSDWAQLESGTFRFRDPLNKERRFLPLRLDDAPIKGSLAQFLHIDWLPADRDQEYSKLVQGCRPYAKSALARAQDSGEPNLKGIIPTKSQKQDARRSPGVPRSRRVTLSEVPSRQSASIPERQPAVPPCDSRPLRKRVTLAWLHKIGQALQNTYGHPSVTAKTRTLCWEFRDYPTSAPESREILHIVSFTPQAIVSDLIIQKKHGPYGWNVRFSAANGRYRRLAWRPGDGGESSPSPEELREILRFRKFLLAQGASFPKRRGRAY